VAEHPKHHGFARAEGRDAGTQRVDQAVFFDCLAKSVTAFSKIGDHDLELKTLQDNLEQTLATQLGMESSPAAASQ
jgi:hypothetical protein